MRRAHGMSSLCGTLALLLVLLPSAAGAAGGEGGLINLDKSLIIQVVNFVILLFLLSRILYRPVLAKMEERTAAIKKSLEEAQTARTEAQRQREEHAAALRAAMAEAQAIRDAARKDAVAEQRKLVEQARAEAAQLVESTRAQLDQDVRRARETLRQEVGDLAVQVAERLIRKSLRDDDHRRIVADAIRGLERTS